MKSKLIIVTAVIAILTNFSYGFEELKTREDYEKIIKQQQVKIEVLEKTVSELKKQLLDLRSKIYHLKYGADSNEAEQSRDRRVENKKLQTIIESQKTEIQQLRSLFHEIGINPNADVNSVPIQAVKHAVKDYEEGLTNFRADSMEKKELRRAKALKYTVVEKQDVSYLGTPRMVFRVVVKTNRIPSEAQLKDIAISLWKDGNKHWKEFTVFMYLPYMDTHSVAYGIGRFVPQGLKEFEIDDYAIDLQKELTSKNTHQNKMTEEKIARRYNLAQNLRVGEEFKLSKKTPLMPNFRPAKPLEAIAKMQYLTPGTIIKVLKVAMDRQTPWYYVEARSPLGTELTKGWINSIALLGQD